MTLRTRGVKREGGSKDRVEKLRHLLSIRWTLYACDRLLEKFLPKATSKAKNRNFIPQTRKTDRKRKREGMSGREKKRVNKTNRC